MNIHKGLTQQRWNTFSILQQLANIGTDIERVIQWKMQGNKEYSDQAFERALELLDMTIADQNRGSRRRELLRVREALVDHLVYDNEYNTTTKSWQEYFYQFNYAAAMERGR